MRVAVYVAGTKNEAASELKWVLAEAMLAMPAGLRTFSSYGVVLAQQVEQGSLVQFGGAISFALFVYQQRESDSGVFPEMAGIVEVAETDHHKSGAFAREGLLMFAQLRDVLSAEDSPVVTQKNYDRRRTGPQRSQLHWMTIRVWKRNAC